MSKDYIPKRDAEFDGWLGFLIFYVAGKCSGTPPEWTHIPQEAWTIVSNAFGVWHEAFERLKAPHTQVDTEAKNNAKDTAKALIRLFVNQYLRFPPVTNEDRTAMRIPNRAPHPKPVKPPEKGPSFSIIQLGPGMLGIIYRNGEKGRRGSKPEGVAGARIYYGIFGEPVTDQEQLPASKWATRCPHVIRFREADRGKRVYIALKWEIRKENGESGWSEIQSEIIP
jgi:hypothetical protein